MYGICTASVPKEPGYEARHLHYIEPEAPTISPAILALAAGSFAPPTAQVGGVAAWARDG